MPIHFSKNLTKLTIGSLFLICLGGVLLRFYHITQGNFFLYDEGFYLNLHRKYLELIANNPPKNWHDFWAGYEQLSLNIFDGD